MTKGHNGTEAHGKEEWTTNMGTGRDDKQPCGMDGREQESGFLTTSLGSVSHVLCFSIWRIRKKSLRSKNLVEINCFQVFQIPLGTSRLRLLSHCYGYIDFNKLYHHSTQWCIHFIISPPNANDKSDLGTIQFLLLPMAHLNLSLSRRYEAASKALTTVPIKSV